MSRRTIHPSAVVDSRAELDDEVAIGPFAVIGPKVRIGSGTTVGAHTVIEGNTTIGRNNRIFQFAAIGAVPQDLKYRGEDSQLIIGDGNRIREFATLHPGTASGGMITKIGDNNLLMNYTHVAHDSILGSYNVLANGVQLAGHVIIEDFVVLGAMSGIHQFVRIGESAIVGAGSMVSQDVPPFCNATGDRATLHGLNNVGLRRRGFTENQIRALKHAYHILFQSKLKLRDAIQRVYTELPGVPEVERLVAFIEKSQRGVCR